MFKKVVMFLMFVFLGAGIALFKAGYRINFDIHFDYTVNIPWGGIVFCIGVALFGFSFGMAVAHMQSENNKNAATISRANAFMSRNKTEESMPEVDIYALKTGQELPPKPAADMTPEEKRRFAEERRRELYKWKENKDLLVRAAEA